MTCLQCKFAVADHQEGSIYGFCSLKRCSIGIDDEACERFERVIPLGVGETTELSEEVYA